APATLVDPMTLTYQDTDGDDVAVRFSRPLLDAANVDSLFSFDTGPISGNATPQQLQTIDLTGVAAQGISLAVTASPSATHGRDGLVNVGYLNATGIDLGAVRVGGDLGRIDAGDLLGGGGTISGTVARGFWRLA